MLGLLTMTIAMITLCVCIAGFTGYAVAEESLTAGQTWTVVGILAAVLAGVAKLLHWVGNRFMASMDKQTDKFSSSIEKHSETVVGNTTEIGKLVGELRQLAINDSVFKQKLDDQREQALEKIEGAIERVPGRVADEMQRRKIV